MWQIQIITNKTYSEKIFKCDTIQATAKIVTKIITNKEGCLLYLPVQCKIHVT